MVPAGGAGRATGAAGRLVAALSPRQLTEPQAVLRAVGLAGIGVGAAFAVAPRVGLRLIGLESEGRGVSLLARLFASRDLAIGAAALRATRREPLDPQWLELIALFQVGDLALTGALHRTGNLSRRTWWVVAATAGPTLAVSAIARVRAGERLTPQA